jgi:hypothetical protein
MLPVAGFLIALIGLQAIDDVHEGRPSAHTWAAGLTLVAAVAGLMILAVATGRLAAA